jgi:hypothetical protein
VISKDSQNFDVLGGIGNWDDEGGLEVVIKKEEKESESEGE